jgi:hypothetical protein
MTRLVKAALHPTLGTSTLTVTRTGTATRINERGLMESCAVASPRFDYNPVTKACRGLLSEPTSTNVCLQSENFGTTWAAIGTPTRSAQALSFGILRLDLIGDDSGTALEGYSQVVTFTGNAVKALSIFLKAGTAPSAAIKIRDTSASADRLRATVTWSTAGVPTVVMQAGTSLGTDDFGAGLYRFRFQSTSVTAANTNQIEVYPATDAAASVALSGDVYAGGVQAENADSVSTYIPTTTGTVTRGDEDFVETTIGTWFNTIEGTLVASATLDNVGTGSDAPAIVAINDNTTSEELQIYATRSSGTRGFKVVDGGVTQADTAAGAATNGTPFTVAAAYKANDVASSVDGAAVVTDVSVTLPTPTRWRLGGNGAGGNRVKGWIRSFAYYRKRLVNADLQTLAGGGTVADVASLAFDFTGAALEAQSGTLSKPRIGWQTNTRGLTATNVTVSTEATDFPRDAPLRPSTWEQWKPTAAPATWKVDFGSVKSLDYVGILGSGANVQVEVSEDDSAYKWVCGGISLDLYESGATVLLFPVVRARYLKLTIDAVGLIGVVHAGSILSMERHVTGDHQPLNLSRQTELTTTISRGGHFLDDTIRRMGFKAPIAFQSLTPSWWRASFDPFVKAARQYPYFIAWNPNDWPEDVAYGWHEDDIAPRYMNGIPLLQTSWTVIGFDA